MIKSSYTHTYEAEVYEFNLNHDILLNNFNIFIRGIKIYETNIVPFSPQSNRATIP